MIFEITPEHITSLSDTDLRTVVGKLAESEMTRQGYSASGVTYGGHQNAGDGGIDVRAMTTEGVPTGYLPRASTAFQVKAEDMPASAIKAEMRPKDELRQSIAELGEVEGAYIIVSSKGSVADSALSKRKNAMAAAIADVPSAAGLHLDFYDRQRLASWVNQCPGLVPWVREKIGLPLQGWRAYEDWSSSPGAPNEPYLLDDGMHIIGTQIRDHEGLDTESGIEQLRGILSKPKGSVRLVGLSGVGKTRFVQALFEETVGKTPLPKSQVVYTDLSEGPNPVPLELLSHLLHRNQECVLVVDNCGVELHRKLMARLRNVECKISIVTIEYDVSDDEPENTDTFRLEPASSHTIEKVIKRRFSNLTSPEIQTITQFAEGNFRIALALAETAQNGDSLATLKDSDLMRRLFHQNKEENPALLRAAKACSLVYSFNGEDIEGDEAELPNLAALAGQSISEFHGHVAELYRRKLIQKRSKWRALLPHALAHKLAQEALQDFLSEEIEKHLYDDATLRLQKSFSRRLGCLHESEEAQKIILQWLASETRLARIDSLNSHDTIILKNVAPVAPAAVLNAVEGSVSNMRDGSSSQVERYEVPSLLRSLAYDADKFDRAVSIIARLASDHTKSNNTADAGSVFKSLFFLYLSGTHATARQRSDFIRDLANSTNERRVDLVMSALDSMLECSHFSSGYGFEFGVRKRDYGFRPKSDDELTNWYSEVFVLARDLADMPDFRNPVRKMISRQFRFLALRTRALDELIELAYTFMADGGWSQGWVGAKGALRAAQEAKLTSKIVKLSELADSLEPTSITELIASYVLPEQFSSLDIAEIDFDDEDKYKKARDHADQVCRDIGKKLAKNSDILGEELPALLEARSPRAWALASSVGESAKAARETWDIIAGALRKTDEQSSRASSFPGNFLGGLSKQNPELAEQILDEVLSNPDLHKVFVHMQVVVGLNERGQKRILAACKLDTIPTFQFGCMSAGRACDKVPAADLKKILLAIGARQDGLDVAIEIFAMRLYSKKSDRTPLEPEEREIGRELLDKVDFGGHQRVQNHRLTSIVKACLIATQDDSFAEKICTRILDAIGVWHINSSDYSKLVAELGSIFPRAVLDVFVEHGPEALGRPRSMFSELASRGRDPLQNVHDAAMLEWVSEKPSTRFGLLAQALRCWRPAEKNKTESSDEEVGSLEWRPVALQLLEAAPDPKTVLQNFVRSFAPSSWSGSRAAIMQSRLPLIQQLKEHPNKAISKAAEVASIDFEKRISAEREHEAGRDRDEQFEW